MKKVILALAMVFATSGLVNANTSVELKGDCTDEAWKYGTREGDGDPQAEYAYTNQYFELYCNDDGSFNEFIRVEL